MSLTSTSRLLAGAAVAAGLTLSGLPSGAAVAAPAARATTVGATASYTCSNPLLGPILGPLGLGSSFTLPASFSLQNLPDVLTANVPVPAGVPFVGTFDIAGAGLSGLLTNLQITAVNGLAGTPLAQVGTLLNGVLAPVVGGVATFESTLGTFTPGTTGLPLPDPDVVRHRSAHVGPRHPRRALHAQPRLHHPDHPARRRAVAAVAAAPVVAAWSSSAPVGSSR